MISGIANRVLGTTTVQFEDQNRGGPMEGHTLRMWERIVGAPHDNLDGRMIADFGCGPGRFVDIVRKKRGRVIGLDLSVAVEKAGEYLRRTIRRLHDPVTTKIALKFLEIPTVGLDRVDRQPTLDSKPTQITLDERI